MRPFVHRLHRPPAGIPFLVLVVTLAAAAGCGKPVEDPVAAPRPRNVLFVVVDALRADHLGTMGYPRETTPRLDAFAADAWLFERAHSATSWTLPSLASYMTSVYPSVHGLRRTPNDPDQNSLAPVFVTLAESLQARGLRTAALTAQPWLTADTGLTQGFDSVEVVSQAGEPREAELLTDRLIEWLGARGDEPFFLYAHYMGPHSPYFAPPPFAGRFTADLQRPAAVETFHRLYRERDEYEAYREIVRVAGAGSLRSETVDYLRAEYDEKLAFTDHSLGRLFDHLESSGRLEDTMVIVTADHGEAFYEHGTIFHGQHLHQELLHVPLVVRLPGSEFRPGRFATLVELIDLYPTIHDVLGFSPPSHIEGHSLIPVAMGAAGDGVAFAEGFGFKVITEEWSSFYDYAPNLDEPDGIRTRELYRLADDPLERRNLLGAFPDVAEAHRRLAHGIWSEMGEVSDHYPLESEAAGLDAETRAKLRSLGYL